MHICGSWSSCRLSHGGEAGGGVIDHTGKFGFLCFHLGTVVSGGIMFSGCLFVRLSVCPFVTSVTKLVNTIFWSEWTGFDENCHKWPQGHKLMNCWTRRSMAAEDRFGGLAKASLSTQMGRVALLVSSKKCDALVCRAWRCLHKQVYDVGIAQAFKVCLRISVLLWLVAHNSTEIRSQKLVAARHDVYVLSLDFNQLRSPMFVCNVRAPAQRVELFGNIFALPNSSGTRTVCIKILGKNSMVY